MLLLGAGFALAGVYIAATYDRIIGLGVLIVGAFLMILPFTAARSDE